MRSFLWLGEIGTGYEWSGYIWGIGVYIGI